MIKPNRYLLTCGHCSLAECAKRDFIERICSRLQRKGFAGIYKQLQLQRRKHRVDDEAMRWRGRTDSNSLSPSILYYGVTGGEVLCERTLSKLLENSIHTELLLLSVSFISVRNMFIFYGKSGKTLF